MGAEIKCTRFEIVNEPINVTKFGDTEQVFLPGNDHVWIELDTDDAHYIVHAVNPKLSKTVK